MTAPGRILLLDNSRSFSRLLATTIGDRLGLPVTCTDSLGAAAAALAEHRGEVFLIISGLVLADADESSIVAFFTQHNLPLVVLTGTIDANRRTRILSRPVIDYVLKDNPGSVDYVVWLIDRINHNRQMTALVAASPAAERAPLAGLARLYGFTVAETTRGPETLAAAEALPRLDLVIIGHHPPDLDGLQVVRQLRARHPRDRVAIIGVSSHPSPQGPISAQFLKAGASDVLGLPFQPEELFCRVALNVENIENIAALHALATTDPLTGLRNRRSFIETAQAHLALLTSAGRRVAVAMIDVDHFKRINDGWGHECGDQVLIAIAGCLAASVRPGDILGRLGGEEFCLLAADLDETSPFFESLRRAVAECRPRHGDDILTVTVSIGICVSTGDGRTDTLRTMLTAADRALYAAKRQGRDRIVFA